MKMICEGNGHISPAPEKVPYKFTPSLPLGCHSGILSEAGSLAEQSVGTAGQSSSCWQRQPRSPGAGGCEGRLTISPGCPGPGLRWLRAGRQPRNVCAQLPCPGDVDDSPTASQWWEEDSRSGCMRTCSTGQHLAHTVLTERRCHSQPAGGSAGWLLARTLRHSPSVQLFPLYRPATCHPEKP